MKTEDERKSTYIPQLLFVIKLIQTEIECPVKQIAIDACNYKTVELRREHVRI